MLPERVHLVDELPLTAHGKIDRQALADRFVDAFVGPAEAP
jgi:non-ribosomal peptide synthetase component E (peptide arylation enzyme)